MRTFLSTAVLASVCSFVGLARGAPVQWTTAAGGNGHWYDFVSSPGIEWADARTAAQASTHVGQPGELVTLTSAAEDSFVDNAFAPLYIEAWAGGTQSPTNNPTPTAGWSWVTGEPWVFTDWAVTEPNDMGGPEYQLSIGGDQNNPGFVRRWNDDSPGTSQQLKSGYLVEYVPEPASAAVIAVGVAAACRIRRRRC